MRSHVLAAALVLTSSFAFGQGQDYPSRPVRLTVGLPAGGTTDLAARLLAEKLRGVLGQPFVVENRPGANNLIAAQGAAAAPNDGYQILHNGTAVTTGPALAKAWNIDAVKDLTPISLLVKGQVAIGTPPGAPYNTIDGGRIELLGVMSGERSSLMPELPSFAESSIKEVREVPKFSGLGVSVVASTPEQLTQTIITERARFILEAKRAGLEPQ